MNFEKFTVYDKVVFIGDPNNIHDKNGNKRDCQLIPGKQYVIENLIFWGSVEFIKVEGDNTHWDVRLFVSKEEYKKINKIVSELIK